MYTYTKTISSQIVNHKRVVEELDFYSGTEDMPCDCNTRLVVTVMSLQGMLLRETLILLEMLDLDD